MPLPAFTIKGSFRYGSGDYKLAVGLVSSGKVDVKRLITGSLFELHCAGNQPLNIDLAGWNQANSKLVVSATMVLMCKFPVIENKTLGAGRFFLGDFFLKRWEMNQKLIPWVHLCFSGLIWSFVYYTARYPPSRWPLIISVTWLVVLMCKFPVIENKTLGAGRFFLGDFFLKRWEIINLLTSTLPDETRPTASL
jgi:hypothetical protein